MKGEQLELDLLAQEVRSRAGVDDTTLISSLTIARRVLGGPVKVLPSLPTQASLVAVDGVYQVVINELSSEAHFAVAHELGHWALLEVARYRGPDEEAFANRIAGAIVAPGPVVRHLVERHGRGIGRGGSLRPLARTTGISKTAANLRMGEVLGDERGVLTGRHRFLMVRSGGTYQWDREFVVRVAAGEEDDPRLEIEALRGGIDHRRVALRAK